MVATAQRTYQDASAACDSILQLSAISIESISMKSIRSVCLAFILTTATQLASAGDVPTEINRRFYNSTDYFSLKYRVGEAKFARVFLLSPNQDVSGTQKYLEQHILGKEYDEKLAGLNSTANQLSQWVDAYAQWLKERGVADLWDAARAKPIEFQWLPSTKEGGEKRSAGFVFNRFDTTVTDWWIRVVMWIPDPDDYLGQEPLVVHELSHFLFQRYLLQDGGLQFPDFGAFLREASCTGAIHEGFADALSYLFTGNPIVGEKFDQQLSRRVPFRVALSSSAEDREKVRKGEWDYFYGDPHLRGEPFRDILIEYAQLIGIPEMLSRLRLLLRMMAGHWAAEGSECNHHLNQVAQVVWASSEIKH